MALIGTSRQGRSLLNGGATRFGRHVPSGTTFSRKEFVLALANKEGGAHVDPEIPEKWALMTRDHAFDPFVSVLPTGQAIPFENVHLALVRQVTFEAWLSLRVQPEFGPTLDRLRPQGA
jgi:hypothetical protein